MEVRQFLKSIEGQRHRFFPEARFIVVEELPFYIKARVIIADNLFIEVRYNAKNNRRSYVLVKNKKRVAGFDNLMQWHMHQKRKPLEHKKITEPSVEWVFKYFSGII